MSRATDAWRGKRERESTAEQPPLYDFTYHVEFGGGRKLGMKLRTDWDTGIWAREFIEAWPAVDRTFGFQPADGGDDGKRGA